MASISAPDIDVDQLMHEIRDTVVRRRSEKTPDQLDAWPAELVAIKASASTSSLERSKLQPRFDPNLAGYHVNDLLKYNGVEFLRNAYRAILKREPDAVGLNEHLGQLATGRLNKIDILAAIAESPEGKIKRVEVDGLKWPIFVRRLQRIPVIGYLLEITIGITRLPVQHRHTRQFEFHHHLQHESLVNQFHSVSGQLELMTGRLSALASDIERITASQNDRLETLKRESQQLASRHAELVSTTNQQFASMQQEISDVRGELSKDSAVLQQRIADLAAKSSEELARTADSLNQERDRIEALSRNLGMHERGMSEFFDRIKDYAATAQPLSKAVAEESGHLLDNLYAAFEDEFRGDRQEIKDRLRVYIPFIHKLPAKDGVLDLGCGRGEWLELMKDEKIKASGVDSNRVAVARCREAGLDVAESDVVTYLRGLGDETLNAITSFHLVEHLPFATLVKMLDECVRTLSRTGVLILETPDPQNFIVGSYTFYTDPTHRNPIPSHTLKFLLESRGLSRTEVIKLRPLDDAKIQGDSEIVKRFNEYFYGAPDYAIVAWKD